MKPDSLLIRDGEDRPNEESASPIEIPLAHPASSAETELDTQAAPGSGDGAAENPFAHQDDAAETDSDLRRMKLQAMKSNVIFFDSPKSDRHAAPDSAEPSAAQAAQTAPEAAESSAPAPAEGRASARIPPARSTQKADSDAAAAAAHQPIPKPAIPARRLAINLLASGWTFLQTAATAGVEPATLEIWGKQPEFIHEIEHVLEARQCCLRARALHYSFKALGALAKMLEDDSPAASQIRMETAKFLLQMSCYRKSE